MSHIGFLSIDKPLHLTSHDVVKKIRYIAHQRRVGHAGTLDPLATGVLLVGIGVATRLIEYIQEQQKTYSAQLRLGQTTDTYDAEGDIITEQPVTLTQTDFLNALPPFRGHIQQQPPMYSAIKRQGQPLYKLARQGIEVERASRPVSIYNLSLTHWDPPFANIDVTCSAGTYIRSLAHDIGQTLGCGAHLTALRRTAIGTFTANQAISLETITSDNLAAHLFPIDTAVIHLPRLDLTHDQTTDIYHGRPLPIPPEHPPETVARAYNPDNTFLGLLKAHPAHWQPHKIFHQQ
ncbi:MAG TPA: tRNA pseudouridine(55) synthase TruB [Anaerolineae bacterium]|nr:tRNA pseudouridine(55) synthase TruB [Anaerolineae bacterium]